MEKLFLLALDDEKGKFVSDSMVFGYCMAGAIIFELAVKERIDISGKKISVKSTQTLHDDTLDKALELISSSRREKKINYWIEAIGNLEGKLRKTILTKLISQGILEEQENKILWIFKSKKYPAKNSVPENIIRRRLNDIILHDAPAETDDIMLISLVNACGLDKEVYGKDIARENNKKIKDLIKDFEFADTTGKVIKEIHDTLAAVLIVVVATTTVLNQ